jgi:hypothetical protein
MKTLATIIETARRIDSQNGEGESAPASVSDLVSFSKAEEAMSGVLRDCDEEALTEILALVWVARGDYRGDRWTEALDCARKVRNARLVTYLASTEGLADLLESGLAELNAGSD